ncbi:hypothetical protein HK405_006310 [Cladochytrium tenue]|nr:hypothetical protein HK405_006310 [Cladochytrium tenue]
MPGVDESDSELLLPASSKLPLLKQISPECCSLYAGSVFVGQQKSERLSYQVSVRLQV